MTGRRDFIDQPAPQAMETGRERRRPASFRSWNPYAAGGLTAASISAPVDISGMLVWSDQIVDKLPEAIRLTFRIKADPKSGLQPNATTDSDYLAVLNIEL